ncbi:hypothetical protein [Nocardia iowensis]|uniref:Serine protease n=1 Tax=Nocardia iowensis TaxID=204891 RepID=A0ABX8RP06_NOCIO|nr:hypothetical protein [Nocardia iowensis]QXN91375.1 hypothetical protein KV110_39730 [Nocardia iowensis]
MSRMRVFGVVLAAAAGVVLAGSGIAGAAPGIALEPGTSVQPVVAPGEPDPTGGTGSSKAVVDVIKALSTGSKGAQPAPTTP